MNRDELIALVHKHFPVVTLEAAGTLADDVLARLPKPKRARAAKPTNASEDDEVHP